MVSTVFGAESFGIFKHPAVACLVDGKRGVVAQIFVFAQPEFAGRGIGSQGAAARCHVDRFGAFARLGKDFAEQVLVGCGQIDLRFGLGDRCFDRLGSRFFTAGGKREDRKEESEYFQGYVFLTRLPHRR